jgi:hypothetical protein
LERVLGGPWPALRPFWLPLLFFLFCLACLLGRWLWRLLGPEREATVFGDIDQAWAEARAALVQAGIDLTAVPLFLVLGRSASHLAALFAASRMTFLVRQAPLRSGAPLQVWANRQGIFVAAFGASLLGRQAELLFAPEGSGPEEPLSNGPTHYVLEEPERPKTSEVSKTSEAGHAPPPVPPPAPPADPALGLSSTDLLVEGESHSPVPGSGRTTGSSPVESPQSTPAVPEVPPTPRPRPSVLRKTEEVESCEQRLRFLCRRIVRDRRPYCPLNGLLLLLPLDGLETEKDASHLATVCQHDLEVVRQAGRTGCPVYVLVPDLDRVPGFDSLARALTDEGRQRLLGRDFPLLPDIKEENLPRMVEGGMRSFFQAFAGLVFRLFQVEGAEDQSLATVAGNTRLYELLGSLQAHWKGLEWVLTRLITTEGSRSFRLGGCFLGATGDDPDRSQAFVPGVFRLLVENQNAVAWTGEALAEEADYRRWTFYGYAALACFSIVVLLVGYWRWQQVGW